MGPLSTSNAEVLGFGELHMVIFDSPSRIAHSSEPALQAQALPLGQSARLVLRASPQEDPVPSSIRRRMLRPTLPFSRHPFVGSAE